MSRQTVCINQFLRPREHINIEGIGNCTICEADDENKLCKNYSPINVFLMDTIEEEEE
jgi:hypothetical protein